MGRSWWWPWSSGGDKHEEDVRQFGWSMISISDYEPPFQYTLGLMVTFQHPELILFGLEASSGHALVSALIREIRAGKTFAERGVQTIDLNGEPQRIGLRRVHPTQHPLYLGYAMGYQRTHGNAGELEAMQIFWHDRAGKFPFDGGCDLDVYNAQPRIDIGLSDREVRKWQRQWE